MQTLQIPSSYPRWAYLPRRSALSRASEAAQAKTQGDAFIQIVSCCKVFQPREKWGRIQSPSGLLSFSHASGLLVVMTLSTFQEAGGDPGLHTRSPLYQGLGQMWLLKGRPSRPRVQGSDVNLPLTYSSPPQVVLSRKGFPHQCQRQREREELYFSLFIALKHLLLCYVLQRNLASHIHKLGCFGFNCVNNSSYKLGSVVVWKDFRQRSK